MYTKSIDEIEFEGVIVKPRGGVYKCPFCKGDPRYPVPSWKTLNGFKKHMGACNGKPSRMAVKAEKEAAQKLAEEEMKIRHAGMVESAKLSSPVKIGDSIHVCYHVVTKPTHEWRGTRRVHVRYDEERDYRGETVTVTDITASDKGSVVLVAGHRTFFLSELFPTLEDAKAQARSKQSGYDAGVKEASSYR